MAVTEVLSQRGGGYVQDEALRQGLVRADVGVVLAGVPGMLEAARAMYAEEGNPVVLEND